jgi:multimeric flavodoxin WrbA
MTLRLLAIHGSARPHGNSRRLLDEVLESATAARADAGVETVRAYEAGVDPCIACDGCNEDDVGCVRHGDGWAPLETSLRAADALVLASPVYFMGLPAPVKAIVDRLQALWWYRERGGTVATNEGPFRRAVLVLTAAGEGEEAFVPSRRMAMAAFNTLGFETVGTLLAGGLENAGEVEGRPELLEEARRLGVLLVEGER